MGLKNQILGLIAFKPCNGYTLHKRFFKPGRPAISHIYRALNELQAEKLIQAKKVENKKHPASYEYCATEKGHARLVEWLSDTSATKIKSMEEPIPVKLCFGSMCSVANIIKLLESFIDSKLVELNYYKTDAKGLEQRSVQSFGNAQDKLYLDLVFDYVKKRGEVEIKWARKAIKEISNQNIKVL